MEREKRPGAKEVLDRLPAGGVYQVMFVLDRKTGRRIGALGRIELPAGHWVYTGSAKRGLRARVARHLSVSKKRRWHIDYVLPPGRPVAVRGFDRRACECAAHRRLSERFTEGPRGFGSSDCRCASHLVYLGEKGLHLPGFLQILAAR